MIAELINLAKDIVAEAARGARFTPPLDEDQLAFFDAVATNESAVDVMARGSWPISPGSSSPSCSATSGRTGPCVTTSARSCGLRPFGVLLPGERLRPVPPVAVAIPGPHRSPPRPDPARSCCRPAAPATTGRRCVPPRPPPPRQPHPHPAHAQQPTPALWTSPRGTTRPARTRGHPSGRAWAASVGRQALAASSAVQCG